MSKTKRVDEISELMEHSKAKIRLLEAYINLYLNIIANDGFTTTINVFDLFCGEGKYDNGDEGSPIVLLRAAKNAYSRKEAQGGRIRINVLLNDIDKDKIKKLRQSLAELKLHHEKIGKLRIEESDYQEIVEQVTSEVGGYGKEKAFIFIDPYGYKDIRTSHIRSLLETKKAEILLFLPIAHIYRFHYRTHLFGRICAKVL